MTHTINYVEKDTKELRINVERQLIVSGGKLIEWDVSIECSSKSGVWYWEEWTCRLSFIYRGKKYKNCITRMFYDNMINVFDVFDPHELTRDAKADDNSIPTGLAEMPKFGIHLNPSSAFLMGI